MGKGKSIQQVLLGNLDSCMQSNETRTHLHTMHKNKLKMAERLKYKTRHHQTPGDDFLYQKDKLWMVTVFFPILRLQVAVDFLWNRF